MSVESTRSLGERIRRSTTNRDVLAYIDATLALTVKKVDVTPKTLSDLKREATGKCPICEARRKAKNEAQQRWREKSRK